MNQPAAEDEFFQLLGRGAHAGVALADGDYRETVAVELRGQLCGVPTIERNLADAESRTQLIDAAADPIVVDDLARRGLDVVLADPLQIG